MAPVGSATSEGGMGTSGQHDQGEAAGRPLIRG
jgi:hypothetical protein